MKYIDPIGLEDECCDDGGGGSGGGSGGGDGDGGYDFEFDLGEFIETIVDGVIGIFDPNPIPDETYDPDIHKDLIQIAKCQEAKKALRDCIEKVCEGEESDCSDEEKAANEACGGIGFD